MGTIRLDLAEDVVALLRETNRPLEEAAQEAIVLELYRRGAMTSGRAAQLLGTDRFSFIKHASSLGIPFIDMTEEEWANEARFIRSLQRS